MGNLERIVGEKVRAMRKDAGLSQAELAEKVKSSTRTINRVENGRQFPGNLDAICEALGHKTEDLFAVAPPPPQTRADLLGQIILNIEDLKQEDLAVLLDFARGLRDIAVEVDSNAAAATKKAR